MPNADVFTVSDVEEQKRRALLYVSNHESERQLCAMTIDTNGVISFGLVQFNAGENKNGSLRTVLEGYLDLAPNYPGSPIISFKDFVNNMEDDQFEDGNIPPTFSSDAEVIDAILGYRGTFRSKPAVWMQHLFLACCTGDSTNVMFQAQTNAFTPQYFDPGKADLVVNPIFSDNLLAICFFVDTWIQHGGGLSEDYRRIARETNDLKTLLERTSAKRLEYFISYAQRAGRQDLITGMRHRYAIPLACYDQPRKFEELTTGDVTAEGSISVNVDTSGYTPGGEFIGSEEDSSALAEQYADYSSGTIQENVLDLEGSYYDTSRQPVHPFQYQNFKNNIGVVIELQFLQDLTGDPSQDWKSMHVYPYKHVKEFKQECTGINRMEITLVDTKYHYLEDAWMKAVFLSNFRKMEAENQILNSQSSAEGLQSTFTEVSMANIRWRFGYSTNIGGDVVFDDEEAFQARSETQTIRMSPWFEGYILNSHYMDGKEGLEVKLEVTQITSSILNNCKVFHNGFKINGENTRELISKLLSPFSDRIGFSFSDPPDSEVTEIQIPQQEANRPETSNANSYSSIADYIREILDQIQSRIYDRYGNQKEPEWAEHGGHSPSRIVPYKFKIKTQSGKKHLEFGYFLNDIGTSTNPIREYYYRYSPYANVLDLDLEVPVIQASVTAVSVMQSSGPGSSYEIKATSYDNPETDGETLGTYSNVTDLTRALKNQDFLFVSDVSNPNMYNQNSIHGKVINELNKRLASGKITIMGDPFYIHDAKVSPFMYKIRLTIKRPDGYDSFMSGDYLVGNVTHTIDQNGYTTELDVRKAF